MRAIAIVAGAVLLFSPGCAGSSHSDGTAPSSDPASSPSPSWSRLPLTDAELKAEAEQFVRDYYAAVNQAMSSGDPSKLAEFTEASCPCRELMRVIGRIQSDHRVVDPASFHLRSVKARVIARKAATVDVVYDLDEEVIRDLSGTIVARIPGQSSALSVLTLVWVRGTWRVNNAVGVR